MRGGVGPTKGRDCYSRCRTEFFFEIRYTQAMPTNNLIRQLPMAGRANFLPYQIGADGKPHWALPGVLAGAANAVTAPYRATRRIILTLTPSKKQLT